MNWRRIAFLLLCPALLAQTAADAAKQLAGKILAHAAARSTVNLIVENRSSLDAGQTAEIRSALESQLRAGGVELGESDTKLRVTIGEDRARFLLAAQTGTDADLVSWKKPPPKSAEYRMSIQRIAVFEQREPILDLTLSSDGQTLTILEPERAVEYAKNNSHWRLVRALPLSSVIPSRDPRGRLAPTADRVAPGRNYFTGGPHGDFYTQADVDAGVLIAGLDGRTTLIPARGEPGSLQITDWGSDFAAIDSPCAGRLVLATTPSTDSVSDRLQAFDVTATSATPVSEPLLLPGPVTALWSSETPTQVTVVVRNQHTGMYEASRVSLSCTQ